MAKSKRNTFCPHCGRVVPAGRACSCRNRDAQRRTYEPWRSSYRDPEYVRNRQIAIERQQGRCIDCGKICAEWDGSEWKTQKLGGEVDHERPLCEGGANDASNLALRCKKCHASADASRRMARSARAVRPRMTG
jgi:5-methylcytosine-specific restriction endonuclease McrA